MSRPLSRSAFLGAAVPLALGLLALPWAGPVYAQTPRQPNDKKKKKNKPLPQPGDDWRFDCGKYWIADLGPSRHYDESPCLHHAEFKDFYGTLMEKERIYIRRERLDVKTLRYIILSAVCTHLKCRVEYRGDCGHFVCPCHGSEFDLEGEVLHKPAKRPLPDYSDLLLNLEGQLYLRRVATRKSEKPIQDPEEETPKPNQKPR